MKETIQTMLKGAAMGVAEVIPRRSLANTLEVLHDFVHLHWID